VQDLSELINQRKSASSQDFLGSDEKIAPVDANLASDSKKDYNVTLLNVKQSAYPVHAAHHQFSERQQALLLAA